MGNYTGISLKVIHTKRVAILITSPGLLSCIVVKIAGQSLSIITVRSAQPALINTEIVTYFIHTPIGTNNFVSTLGLA